jgi:hypothetical protein
MLVRRIEERGSGLTNAMGKIAGEKKESTTIAKGGDKVTTQGEKTHIEKTIARFTQASPSCQPR